QPLIADAVEHAFAEQLDAVLAGAQSSTGRIPALPASALSSAILDREGAIIWAQDRFAALVARDLSDFSNAFAQLSQREVALAHARTREDKAVCLVVAAPSAAKRWPIQLPAKTLNAAGAGARVAVAVAMDDQSDALAAAARAFGFTALETRVAVALVHCGALPDAAARCGVTYQTARDVIKGARRKAGVGRMPALVARLTSVAAQLGDDNTEADRVLVDAFGITPREAALALAL